MGQEGVDRYPGRLDERVATQVGCIRASTYACHTSVTPRQRTVLLNMPGSSFFFFFFW